MIEPHTLRLIANTWRNISGVAAETFRTMAMLGIEGAALEHAKNVGNYAAIVAMALEERADELEAMKQPTSEKSRT